MFHLKNYNQRIAFIEGHSVGLNEYGIKFTV